MITKIQKTIESKFTDNWLGEYQKREGDLDQELKKAATEIREEVLNLVIISLLSGEYASEKELILQLNTIENFIDSQFDSFPEDDSIQDIILRRIKLELVDILKIYIRVYKNFKVLLDAHVKYPNYDIVFSSNPSIKSFLPKKEDESISREINFFYYLVTLQRLDHFFQDDFNYYKNLLDLEELLSDKEIISKYKVVAKEKVQYLKFKWEVRQKTYFQTEESFTPITSYVVDDELKLVAQNPENHSTSKKLQEWQKYLECHYEFNSNWKFQLQKKIDELDFEDYSELSLNDLHALIKYYKDINPNYTTLEEITQEIESRLNNTTKANKHSYQKALIYSLNNLFSMLLKSKKPDIAQVETLREQISDYQIKYKIDNFFTDYKYLDFVITRLVEEHANRGELESNLKTKESLDKIEGIFEEYRKKVRWTKSHYNLLFSLPFEDCLVDTNLKELPLIYYPSGFSLPLPHSHVQKNFDKLFTRFEKISISYSSIETLEKEFSLIKNLKDDLQKNDFKSIEIIGIFTAIITVVMATIPSLKFINSLEQAVYFTFTLAASFSLFLFGIFSLTRGLPTFKKNLVFFITTGGIIIFCVYLFINFPK